MVLTCTGPCFAFVEIVVQSTKIPSGTFLCLALIEKAKAIGNEPFKTLSCMPLLFKVTALLLVLGTTTRYK